MNAIRSIETAIITDIVGSLVIIQGIIPSNAITKKIVSDKSIFLNPYCKENIKINNVNISEAAVGNAPIPAPFANCPKNVIADTVVHTIHVYG